MALTLDAATLMELLDGAYIDSGAKNIVSNCPFCGRPEKFGISILKQSNPFQCLSSKCGERGKLYKLLGQLDRLDLIGPAIVDTSRKLESILNEDDYEELDINLEPVALPEGYRRVGSHPYLDSRNFNDDDFFYFEVGTSDNFKFKNYVIFPIKDDKRVVGYVSRHIWSKQKIDRHNDAVTKTGTGYKILRYRNSDNNETGRMLYNYDKVVEGKTTTVIVVEGVFDVINITRELELYDQNEIIAVACFGSKLSIEQIYKLQLKGVTNVILFFDVDAVNKVKAFCVKVNRYFSVLVATYMGDDGRDAGDLEREEILEILDEAQHPYEFKRNVLSKII